MNMNTYIEPEQFADEINDDLVDYYCDDNYGQCSRCGNRDSLNKENLCDYCNQIWGE